MAIILCLACEDNTKDGFADDATADDATADDATADDATADDATADDAGGECHSLTFGAPEVGFTMVASLPTMTGGSMMPGVYDAVSVETTTSIPGRFRASWEFSESSVNVYQQLTISEPGAIVPRSYSWRTSGNKISRIESCPGDDEFENEFTVEGDVLKVRQATVMFVFQRRAE